MKPKVQILLITFGIIALGYMAYHICFHVQTMILPAWLIAIFIIGPIIILSIVLGDYLKHLFKLRWSLISISSVLVSLTAFIYFIINYRPSYIIYLPENYVGEIRLFVSNNSENNLHINKYGIGYITKKTYEKGFYPIIIKGEKDITGQFKFNGYGTLMFSKNYPYLFDYMSFIQTKRGEIKYNNDVDSLIKNREIDTTRLVVVRAPE